MDENKLAPQWSRFSLRMLLVAVTAMGVLLYLVMSAPEAVATPGLYIFNILFMAFVIAGSLYASENLQAFCRGAAVPTVVHYLYLSWFMFAIMPQIDYTVNHLQVAFAQSAHWSRPATIFSCP